MSWSRLGQFKPWLLILEVRKHLQNYDFSEKKSFSLKNHIFGVFGVHCGATIFFLLFVAIRGIT